VPTGVGLLPDDGAGNGVLYLGTTSAFGAQERLQVIDSADRRPVGVPVVKDGVGQNTVAVAPDRSWIAFDNYLATPPDTAPSLQVSSLHTGERLAKFPLPANDAHLVAVDPAGRRILVGSRNTGASFLVDTATWQRRPSGLPDGAVTVSAFSPDGRHLVTVDLAGELMLRDAQSFAALHAFQADAGSVNTFAALPLVFSADGRHLVSAHDGLGRLWDVASGQLIGQPIPSLPSSSPSAVPGDHAGFIGTSEQFVQVWDFDVDRWRDLACRLAGRNLTPTEWAQFGPRDLAHRPTCAAWS
jgi:WD40 repeat protein